MTQLVILGRDGVINQRVEGGVRMPEHFSPLPGSLEAIARLNHAGYTVTVFTRQPGLARAELDIEALNAIHARLQQLLSRVGGHIDGLFICPHDGDTSCDCHKPYKNLLQAISGRFDVSLEETILISDDSSDLLAARNTACRTLLVRSGNGITTLENLSDVDSIRVVEDLAQAVDMLSHP